MLPFEPFLHVPTEFLLLWFVVPFRSGGRPRRPAVLLRLAPDDRAAVLRERGLARRALAAEAHHPRMRNYYAAALCNDECATLGELREAVTTLEDTTRIARRVLGSAHPHTTVIEGALQHARAALRARETQPPPRSA